MPIAAQRACAQLTSTVRRAFASITAKHLVDKVGGEASVDIAVGNRTSWFETVCGNQTRET